MKLNDSKVVEEESNSDKNLYFDFSVTLETKKAAYFFK